MEESVREKLRSLWPGLETHFAETCRESSQDIARRLLRPGRPCLVVCSEILEARGRMGRKWLAPRGGLWFSLALGPLQLENLGLLALACGVSVAKAIARLTGLEVRLKWPNDVLVRERKVAGILVEAFQAEGGLVYVLGVGVNVNNLLPGEMAGVATSLVYETENPPERGTLLVEILASLREYLQEIVEGHVERVISDYRGLSATIGQRVRVRLPGGVELEGKAVDVDEAGRLVVETMRGVFSVEAGDVEHLRHTDIGS
ncbi:biotin--[acetyl-CoA-carboxylase] ligase [Infirmifilum lucidum]|uniref:Biotin--[acetyl-CoA-carboxylase] ligase n=1 Tax=Infirmifilum lucidum TaxID=2776706 RepID=A0A7L9FK06_9CREN|nr:biotin--[acetyl-CoA-carboxylase] ligase [Infirmifilum lucidum]QOJ79343.1 biotin--[acetyl-CoA-carboxylase] ligase [Infirmifilum lucidum]